MSRAQEILNNLSEKSDLDEALKASDVRAMRGDVNAMNNFLNLMDKAIKGDGQDMDDIPVFAKSLKAKVDDLTKKMSKKLK